MNAYISYRQAFNTAAELNKHLSLEPVLLDECDPEDGLEESGNDIGL